MTLIVSTGNLLLADRCVEVGNIMFGAPKGHGSVAYINNVCKIQRFDKGYIQVADHRVVALAQSGTTTHSLELWQLLNAGVLYLDMVQYELQVQVTLFANNKTVMVTDEGKTLVSAVSDGKHLLSTYAKGALVLSGVAEPYVDAVRNLSERKLTPLDYMVLAARQYRSVSENFDLYSVDTDTLTPDILLSDRQQKLVLDRIQRGLRIDTKPWNHHYANGEL